MAREALGIVGAAVGFVASGFNPMGAYWGFTIGYGVGAYLDPVKVPAPGLNEAPVQTSRDGVPITMFWGLQSGHGNILQKNPEVIVTTSSGGGKGGGADVEEKRRYRTFAIGVGSGPFGTISEYTRIWENNKLVYDVRAEPAIPAAESAKFAQNLRFYYGTEDQLPDPDLEAHWGVDETPAYRGLAYVVFFNKDLTDFGGAIPNYRFEVNGSRDASITSEPYPADAVDGLMAELTFPAGNIYQHPVNAIETTSTPEEGDFGATITEYAFTNAIETTSTPEEGDFGATIVSYAFENAIETTSTPEGGTLS